ncbi:hypothetical protein LMH87_007324 [Akanthomyces muscarius]|uniref:LysM domain-containing protein n=1 Tax=Akanthomyces muscarius TaxID=2231603 RepID=A0A9W8QQJ9_AKAMU|nr:hypothetical protein LMH87_007324 [Akanthomyces muscarius]KAJ4165703.1 hypothetical protein LMH87_007324 [Akanthomyces muscarius]
MKLQLDSGVLLGALLCAARHALAQDTQPSGPTMPNIVSNCNAFHTVKEGSGDSCYTISQKYKISLDNFYKWNPDVKDDCATNFWVGYSYCVGVGAKPTSTKTTTTTTTSSSTKTTPTTSSSSSPTSETSSTNTDPYSTRYPVTSWKVTATSVENTFPPQRTQPGQPADCDDWYLPSAGDSCERVLAAHSWLTRQNLLSWNPVLGEDCTGLFDGWWICVSIRTRNVTVSFSWTTTDAPATVPTLTGSYTPSTLPPVNSSFVASPTMNGVISGCKDWYQAQAGDTCRKIVDGNILTQEDFFKMNPDLDGNCDGLWANYWYCIVGPDGVTAMPSTVSTRPTSVPGGQDGTCKHWYQRDGESCDDIAAMFDVFSRDDFVKWNPSVGKDCDAMTDGAWYCVGVPGTPTTRTRPIPTTFTPDPSTTKSGSATTTGQSTTSPSKTPTSTTSTPTTTSGGGEIATPSPTRDGMVAACHRFYRAQSGDGCWSIANAAKIELDNFYAWNPAVATDCSGLWLNYYYCIGISGPVTTISSGAPIPT